MTVVPLKRRWMQQVAVLNNKYVVRDGRVDFNSETGVGYVYTRTKIEGEPSFAQYDVPIVEKVDGRVVTRVEVEYMYRGHIELTEIEVTN